MAKCGTVAKIARVGGLFALTRRAGPPIVSEAGRQTLKPRLGERRGRPRFDVVGLLVGSLEGWPSHAVNDISAGGSLVESTCPLPLGMRISGTVSIGGQRVPVRGSVRRVAPWGGSQPQAYALGIEWEDGSFPIEEVARDLPAREWPGHDEGTERRRWPRLVARGLADLEYGVSTSVAVLDISGSGALCSSPVPLPVGTRGELRLRLGGTDFQSEVVVCRADTEEEPRKGWRLGARFGTLDEASRGSLNALLDGRIRGT